MLAKVLGQLDIETFLADYWQKKPCIFRQSIADPAKLDANQLAGLACEPDADTRLVFENQDCPWRVEHGPFQESALQALPKSGWMLLVNGLNRLIPPINRLLDEFHFLPSWRVDDVMASYGPEGSSVGPHGDRYDVFLLQMQGRKHWHIATEYKRAILPGLDLRILSDFQAQQSWLLEPGDMLYLPPHTAHHGVATDGPSMTYSIGFRSPPKSELLRGYVEYVTQSAAFEELYQHPYDKLANHGEITSQTIASLLDIVATLPLSTDDMAHWFAQMVTESADQLTEPQASPLSWQAFFAAWQTQTLWADETTRMNYFTDTQGRCQCYINGARYELAAENRAAVARLTGGRCWCFSDFKHGMGQDFQDTLYQAYCNGYVYFPEHD